MNIPFFLFGGFHISKHITIDGNLNADTSGSIAGSVLGNVKVSADLVIEKGSIITGDVYAENLTINGTIKGDVYCGGRVKAAKNAAVHGNIVASEAIIDKDSIIKGAITKPQPAIAEMQIETETDSAADTEEVAADGEDEMPEAEEEEEKPEPESVPQTWF